MRAARALTIRPEEPTAWDFALVLLLLVGGAACLTFGGSLPRWSASAAQLDLKGQAVSVVIDVVHRETRGDRTRVSFQARLHGEPSRGADWLCLEPEWWQDGHRGARPGPNEYCGAETPERSFTKTLDFFGDGVVGVNVALWSRSAKEIASGHREVIVGAGG